MKALLLLTSLAAAGESRFEVILDEQRREQDVPGVSAVVIHDNEIVFAGGSGVADIASGRPATEDTVYYIGSVTKVLTAVLTLHLVDENDLGLDDRVAGIAVATPGGAPTVSVADLLTHSSGLEREGNFNYWFTADFPDGDSLSAYLARTRLRSTPGTELHYSNVGFAVLGQVIESATGLTYSAALQERVLGPLSMNATGARGPASGVAQGYTPVGQILPNASRPFAGVGERIGDRHVRMYHDANAMSPAFGAYSTAHDLGRLALFLLGNGNEQVLSLATRENMRQRQPTGRGLGIGLERNGDQLLATHGGWFAAHRSQLLIDPANGIAVVVLTNSDSAAPRRIADALYRAVLAPSMLSD